MEEVFLEACRHLLHDSFPLAHCRHEIALSADGGIELNVVPVLVLVLEESGVKKDVRAGRLHPERVPGAGELLHHEFSDLGEVRELAELLIAGGVVGRECFDSIYRLKAKMTKHACEVGARRIANLGPLLTSYRFVEIGSPEIKGSFFRDTIQVLKVVSRWHIPSHPDPRFSNNTPIVILPLVRSGMFNRTPAPYSVHSGSYATVQILEKEISLRS
jgi:hypothetical protein